MSCDNCIYKMLANILKGEVPLRGIKTVKKYEEEIKLLRKKLDVLNDEVNTLEEKYSALTETTADAIISTDREDRIAFCNPSAMKMFGYNEKIIGMPSTILMPERYRTIHSEGIRRYLETGIPRVIGATVELEGLKKDGTVFPIELSLSAWKSETHWYFTAIIRDITERKTMEKALMEANGKLEELSNRDGLTNLYNRRYADKAFEVEFDQSMRYRMPLSCLMIDIDHFKNINDTYGHVFGDKVLVHLSNVLLEMARSCDIVARYGGEEFLIILPNTDTKGASDFAERLRATVPERGIVCEEKNVSVNLNISIGVSSYSKHVKNIRALINYADRALYEAKHLGRNRVCCLLPSDDVHDKPQELTGENPHSLE